MKKCFIYKLPIEAQNLFNSDPKKFRAIYRKQFENIIKQDVLQLAEIATPVFEAVDQCNFYDSWTDKFYWYNIEADYKDEALNVFKIYCGDEILNSYDRDYDRKTSTFTINKTILNADDREFFNLLRTAFYYNNYNDKNKWYMQCVKPRYSGCGKYSRIEINDFVESLYKNGKKKGDKMRKTQSGLNKTITAQCRKIANNKIDAKIKSIQDMNRKIIEAREFLAKHNKDFVKGY